MGRWSFGIEIRNRRSHTILPSNVLVPNRLGSRRDAETRRTNLCVSVSLREALSVLYPNETLQNGMRLDVFRVWYDGRAQPGSVRSGILARLPCGTDTRA